MTKVKALISLVVEVTFKDNRTDTLQDQAYEAMRKHINPSEKDEFNIFSSERPYIDMVSGVKVKKRDKINDPID